MGKKEDGKSIDKLAKTKKNNSIQATGERLEGRDNKRTRDGGTNRRNWRGR